MEGRSAAERDRELVSAINRRTGAGLRVLGRAPHGRLGGAVYASWPDGRPAVVTRFLGPLAEAERTAEVLATLRRYWARWMLHQLCWAIRNSTAEAVGWHLDLAESRLA